MLNPSQVGDEIFWSPAFPLRVDSDVECLQEITSEGGTHKSTFRLTHDPMRSEEPKQTKCIQDVLDDPEIQMRARIWARDWFDAMSWPQ